MNAVIADSLRRLVYETADQLAKAGCENPQVEAEWLLAAAIDQPHRHMLYLEERVPEPAQRAHLARMVDRRRQGEPVAYITGETFFRMLRLSVDRRVLIPRPETEGLIDLVLESWPGDSSGIILDAGTGSGAIALALAMEAPAATIVAVDISADALEVARDNQRRYPDLRVEWIQADLARPGFWRTLPVVDLVTGNPPYVARNEWEALPDQVRQWEPHLALDGGTEGLDLIAAILQGAAMRLRPGGRVLLEIGEKQAEQAVSLAHAHGFEQVRVAPDLAGRPRYLIAHQRQGRRD